MTVRRKRTKNDRNETVKSHISDCLMNDTALAIAIQINNIRLSIMGNCCEFVEMDPRDKRRLAPQVSNSGTRVHNIFKDRSKQAWHYTAQTKLNSRFMCRTTRRPILQTWLKYIREISSQSRHTKKLMGVFRSTIGGGRVSAIHSQRLQSTIKKKGKLSLK